MYSLVDTITDTETTVTTSLVNSLTQDIVRLIGCGSIKTEISPLKTSVKLTKQGRVESDEDRRADMLIVNYEESTLDNSVGTIGNFTSKARPFYLDTEVVSSSVIRYSDRKLTLSLTYESQYRSKVVRVVNDLRNRLTTDSIQQHTLEYHFGISDRVVGLLSTINDMKNLRLLKTTPFDDYVGTHFDKRIEFINDNGGDVNKSNLVIRESQVGVYGYIKTTLSELKVESVVDTLKNVLSFEYEIVYSHPTCIITKYPLVIYNTPIPDEFRVVRRNQKLGYRDYLDQSMIPSLSSTPHNTRTSVVTGSIVIPEEDNHKLPNPNPFYVRLLSVHVIVDSSNPTHLFYLDEIPGITFNPNILRLMELEGLFMSNTYGSIFKFTLYHNDGFSDNKVNLIKDQRISLVTERDMDITRIYRIDLCILAHLDVMTRPDFTRLSDNINIVNMEFTRDLGIPIDTMGDVLSVYNLDPSMLDPGLIINGDTASMDIALAMRHDISDKFTNKMYQYTLSGILERN